MIKFKDSRGKDSLTLGFVAIAFLIGNIGFIYSFIKGNPVDLIGYGTFISGSIFPWLVREYTEKVSKRNADDNS